MNRAGVNERRRGPIPGVSEAAARSAARIVTLNRGFDEPAEDVIDHYAETAARVRAEDTNW